MTPQDFKAWRKRMARTAGKYSQADAARDLGKTVLMIKLYERHPRQMGVDPPHTIPRAVALACAALEAGLKPLGHSDDCPPLRP